MWNMEATIIPIVIGALGTFTKGLVQGLYELDESCGDCPNYSIVEIDHNTEKSPVNLRRLAVTQNPIKNHQLMLIWKSLKE